MSRILRRSSPDAVQVRRSGEGVYTYCATSSSVDKFGDIVLASGVDFSTWKPPVILFGHDMKRPVARGSNPRRVGEQWHVDVSFPPAGQVRESDECRSLVELGILGMSIGFDSREERPPTKEERARGARGRVFLHSIVRESSLVPVPACPDALRVRAAELVTRGLVSRATVEELGLVEDEDDLQRIRNRIKRALVRRLSSR